MRVVSRLPLPYRHILCLVECSGELLLLGVGAQGVTLLKALARAEKSGAGHKKNDERAAFAQALENSLRCYGDSAAAQPAESSAADMRGEIAYIREQVQKLRGKSNA
ncbi:MAG: flagellar biosynthetic protein FliO [Candidatus Omnitrophica bacterium]|nr:flagellar biosynthetic protein FliO [Candidatus Omnitrophota bacterium]